jgi:hypothetical protein
VLSTAANRARQGKALAASAAPSTARVAGQAAVEAELVPSVRAVPLAPAGQSVRAAQSVPAAQSVVTATRVVQPGKLGGEVRARLTRLRTEAVRVRTWSGGVPARRARMARREVQAGVPTATPAERRLERPARAERVVRRVRAAEAAARGAAVAAVAGCSATPAPQTSSASIRAELAAPAIRRGTAS